MSFLRSLLFFFISLIILILVVSCQLLLFFTPLKVRYFIASRWAISNIWLLSVIVGLDYKVIGAQNIPKKPCVVLANHQSTWETFFLQILLSQQVWVLKKELLYIPFFGWGLALIAPIIINRADKISAIKSVIKQGSDRLKKGLWVIIFPEGTRKNTVGKYQSGGAAIAKSANTMVLPIFHNAGSFWQKGQFIKKSGTITVIVGKTIDASKYSAKELSLKVQEWAKEQENLIIK